MMLIKVIKNHGFTLSLEDTFFGKRTGVSDCLENGMFISYRINGLFKEKKATEKI